MTDLLTLFIIVAGAAVAGYLVGYDRGHVQGWDDHMRTRDAEDWH